MVTLGIILLLCIFVPVARYILIAALAGAFWLVVGSLLCLLLLLLIAA